ncbi:hypothetical protein H1R20_g1070, partial [Candolleomyces eurysporus]
MSLRAPLQAGPSSFLPPAPIIQDSSSSHSFFQNAHGFHMGEVYFFNGGNATIVKGATDNEQWRFNGLPKHPDTSGKQAEYLPNSRRPDVEHSLEWISNSTDLVLCIYGPAGIGKSTLARHLSDELRSVGWLGASAFLSAFPTDTIGSETVIKTLAHELGSIHPGAIPKIVEAMNQCHATSLENHLEGYILEPVRSLYHRHPLIFIVDAIDEWEDHPRFIKSLAHLNSKSAIVKFIITSRMNPRTFRLPDIDNIFMHTYPLRPVSTNIMKLYFDKHLATVPWVDGRKASAADVNKLVDLSGGLPVWASTVISMLSQPFSKFTPHEILSGILARQEVGGSQGLTKLYSNALLRLFPIPEAQGYLPQYMGAVLVLQEPLPLTEFSKLIKLPPHLVERIHLVLSAIQTRSPHDSDNTVHPASTRFHLSFLEYIQAIPAEDPFAISAFDSHSAVGLTCLDLITTLLSMSSNQILAFPLYRYVVKHWLFHVSHGTKRSHDEWVKTPHCSTLLAIPIGAQQRWATLFLAALFPEIEEVMVMEEQDMLSILMKISNNLNEDSGDHWVSDVACLEVTVRLGSDCDRAWYNLGWCYHEMGKRIGSPKMFEQAVSIYRRALELRPVPHPDRSLVLNNLGSALQSLYECGGDVDALNEGISHHRDVLALRPAPHPDRGMSLNNLGDALSTLYSRNGDINALNESISHHRDALALRPAPHPDRGKSLNNLAQTLLSQYKHNGEIVILNEAIVLRRELLVLDPPGHHYRTSDVACFVELLKIRFALTGEEGDRDEIQVFQRELDKSESDDREHDESGMEDGALEEESDVDRS